MPTIDRPSKQLAATFLRDFETLLRQVDLDAVERIYQVLRGARDRGSTVYSAGIGGSAATAAHWATDLGKGAKESRRAPLRVMSLSDNTSWLTALANDEGYDRVFSGQL